jgi:hypothetical protein
MLPAYLEEILSSEEKSNITGHLAACPRCRRALAGLKRADTLLHGLEEVEPPLFFEQRIMARVREEAGQKQGISRILRRLFYPLHIKVPVQAVAMLLVAVFAIHVYRTGEPELKQLAPLPIPLTQPEKGQVTAEAPKNFVPPAETKPFTRPPAGDLPEKSEQRFAAPPFENGGKEKRAADSRAPIREERPSVRKDAEPVMALREKERLPVSAGAASKMQDWAGKQDTDKTLETLLPEQKRKDKMSDTVAAAGESGKVISAPSPSRTMAAGAMKRSVIDLTIQVRDMDPAIREIEARLGQIQARIIERQHHKESAYLKAEIAAQKAAALLDFLETVGRVNLEPRPLVVPEGNVTFGIKIVSEL